MGKWLFWQASMNWAIIGAGNGLSHVTHEAITQTNTELSSSRPIGKRTAVMFEWSNLQEIPRKLHFRMSSTKSTILTFIWALLFNENSYLFKKNNATNRQQAITWTNDSPNIWRMQVSPSRRILHAESYRSIWRRYNHVTTYQNAPCILCLQCAIDRHRYQAQIVWHKNNVVDILQKMLWNAFCWMKNVYDEKIFEICS